MGKPDDGLAGLISAARGGDGAAEGELLDRYRNYLTLVARMSLRQGLKAKVDASDVVQDVFLRAHRGFPAFRGATHDELVVWLKQILVHRLTDLNRRFLENQGRREDRERSLEMLVERSSAALGALPAARGTTPSGGAQRREVEVQVADALAAMKEEDREVILLRSFMELEWSEVARRMERSAEAARAQWGRAIQRLGALLEERRCGTP